eukprot:symbB.v1.2.004321.t1/scaffold188.1/size279614/10
MATNGKNGYDLPIMLTCLLAGETCSTTPLKVMVAAQWWELLLEAVSGKEVLPNMVQAGFLYRSAAEIQEAEQLKLVSMERKRQGAVYLRSCDVSRVVMLAGRPMLETSNTVKQRKNGRLQMRSTVGIT